MPAPLPTSSDYAAMQQMIVLEVGDDQGILAGLMPSIWASFASKRLVAPRLQELYAKHKAIKIMLGVRRQQVDTATGPRSTRGQQEVATLLAMKTETEGEIATLEAQARAVRLPAVGQIINTTPTVPPWKVPSPYFDAPGPDANAPEYRGDPYQMPPVVQK